MADADVGAAEAFKPLSGGRPHVEAGDLPASLVEVSSAAQNGFLGLTGAARVVVNVSAVVLVGILFTVSFYELLTQNRTERAMFREELKVMHDDSGRKWEAIRDSVQAINANQTAIIGLAELVREGRKTTETLTTAVRDLTAEVKKNTAEVRRRFPAPAVPLKEIDGLDGIEQGLNKPAGVPVKKPAG